MEVYRHDEGGWLAIRPPAGSFCLVEPNGLKMAAETGVAEVVQDGLICYVGSRVAKDGQPISHVRLRQGELVELADDSGNPTAAKSEAGGRKWYRISPPAGEFRWVRAEDVVQKAEQVAGVSDAAHETETEPSRPKRRDSVEPVRIPVDGERLSNASAKPKSEPSEHRAIAKKDEPVTASPGADASDARWVSRNKIARDDLASLERDLSIAVAQEVDTWRLGPLRQRVELFLAHADTESAKSQAGAILERIQQFERLQTRMAETVQPAPLTKPPSSPSATSEDRAATVEAALAATSYDGTGWLVPVHSSKPTVPPFALLDAEGDVLHYVSPTPGLNLQPYVRKQVGVFGQRGYVRSLNKPHVTAERIVDLGRQRR
jgi:hypothetical protein